MACCYIAAFFVGQVVNACQLLDLDADIRYNDDEYTDVISDEKASSWTSVAPKTTATSECDEAPFILNISGMTCAACTDNVERSLMKVLQVDRVRVSLPLQRATIFCKEGTSELSGNDLVKAVENAGYGASIGRNSPGQAYEILEAKKALANIRSSFMGISRVSLLTLGLDSLYRLPLGETTLLSLRWGSSYGHACLHWGRFLTLCILSLALQYRHGYYIHSNAFQAAKCKTVNMDTLVSLSTCLGILLSTINTVYLGPVYAGTYFHTTTGLVMVVTAGRYLDLLSRRVSWKNIGALYATLSRARSARLSSGQTIPVAMLVPGDQVLIEPYTTISCDSYIIDGTSIVDESIITGESVPVSKTVGDFLLAGTRNAGSGTFTAMVQKVQEETYLGQLIDSVAETMTGKPVSQGHLEYVIHYFVLGVLCLTLVFSAVTVNSYLSRDFPLLSSLNAGGERAMTVLMAACPCALGLATPSAVAAGIEAAWDQGILIQDGPTTMERLRKVTHIVLDKTGTLTLGALQVSSASVNESWEKDWETLCVLVCAAEENIATSHPIAKAVFRYCLQQGLPMWSSFKQEGQTKNLQDVLGHGLSCEVSLDGITWRNVSIGSKRHLEQNLDCSSEGVKEFPSQGFTVHIAIDGSYAGFFELQDEVRPDAEITIRQLKTNGFNLTMLTGDSADEARRVSKMLGVPVLASSVLPLAKSEMINALMKEGCVVAMVGDGVNDAPSLATADVGVMISRARICFTAGGSVLIQSTKLKSLLSLFFIAEKTMAQVDANVLWAGMYNIVALSLSCGVAEPWGYNITPPISALMMSCSSIAITFQSLHLKSRLKKSLQDYQ